MMLIANVTSRSPVLNLHRYSKLYELFKLLSGRSAKRLARKGIVRFFLGIRTPLAYSIEDFPDFLSMVVLI